MAIELINGLDVRKARAAVRRFLSAYAWVERHSAEDDFAVGMARPGGVGKHAEGTIRTRSDNFQLDYLPSTSNPKARLSLALYREALGLRNKSYRFLAFFKIINVLHDKSAPQKAWINAALPKLTDYFTAQAVAKLRQTQTDLGKYLYESGRCAIAHAFDEPIADPDDPEDTERLASELPIIHKLAEHLIEHELGIQSEETVRKEHLYELVGFRKHFGNDIVLRLKKKMAVKLEELPVLPSLSFHIRNHLPRATFMSMKAKTVSIENGIVVLICESNSHFASLRLTLNFPAERLEIDPLVDIIAYDDGTSEAMAAAMDAKQICGHVFGNRVMEVWDDHGELAWGRTAPYIPTNMVFDGPAWAAALQQMHRNYLLRLGKEIQRRREN